MSSVAPDPGPGPSTGPGDSPTVALVVPVKTLSRAKTRLHGHPRPALMRAFALDALAAAREAPGVARVYVVTDEPDVADAVRALGCVPLPDRGAGDLNRALVAAVADLPDDTTRVAAMLGDLPCLRAEDLGAALAWAAHAPRAAAYVGDAAGTGTTLLTVGDRADFAPHFGTGSHRAHHDAGYAPVPLPVPSLRQDVDTAADLETAIGLGVGRRTQAVLAEAG